jgi:hypothetical protein
MHILNLGRSKTFHHPFRDPVVFNGRNPEDTDVRNHLRNIDYDLYRCLCVNLLPIHWVNLVADLHHFLLIRPAMKIYPANDRYWW